MNVCFDLGIRFSVELLHNVYEEESFRVAPAQYSNIILSIPHKFPRFHLRGGLYSQLP